MENELEPKLNLGNLAGSLANLVNLANKLSDPATLAKLQNDAQAILTDVSKCVAAVDVASTDLKKAVADLQAILGESNHA